MCPKIAGWKKVNRNMYRFDEKVTATITRVGGGWEVRVQDSYYDGRYDYNKFHKRWTESYTDLVDVMMEISKDIKKKSVRNQIDLLKVTSKTPWYAYLYCGFGMLFSGTMEIVVMTQHLEDFSMGLLLNIALLVLFFMCLSVFVWIFKKNKRDKEKLKELEDMYKTM